MSQNTERYRKVFTLTHSDMLSNYWRVAIMLFGESVKGVIPTPDIAYFFHPTTDIEGERIWDTFHSKKSSQCYFNLFFLG